MTDNDPMSPDSTPESAEVTSSTDGQEESSAVQADGFQASGAPKKSKKTKTQAYLVWIGIVCLLACFFAGYRAAERKDWFQPGAKHLTIMREQVAMEQYIERLRQYGGPACHAVAEMLAGETLPPMLRDRGINNFDELASALSEGADLHDVCLNELIGTLNSVAWALGLVGIGLILLDVLRERGMLPGGKKP